MNPTPSDLQGTLRKVKRAQPYQWVGHLTPSQPRSLVEAGAIASPQDLAWIASGPQAGNDGARWFYFSAPPALRALLRVPVS